MNIMDLDDIIEMPSEVAPESTLESEIDALSKIITDTKDSTHKVDDNDEEFKLDTDDIIFTPTSQCDSIDLGKHKSDLLSDDDLGIKDILDNSGDIENLISSSIVEKKVTSKSIEGSHKSKEKDIQKQAEDSELFESSQLLAQSGETHITEESDSSNINNSLSLISEAYNSQESQSCSESLSASVPDIEEETELLNRTEINELDNEESNSDIRLTKSLSKISDNIALTIEDQKKELDVKITKDINDIEQCDQPDFIQSVASNEDECNTNLIETVESIKEKTNFIDLNKLMKENDEGTLIEEKDKECMILDPCENKNSEQILNQDNDETDQLKSEEIKSEFIEENKKFEFENKGDKDEILVNKKDEKENKSIIENSTKILKSEEDKNIESSTAENIIETQKDSEKEKTIELESIDENQSKNANVTCTINSEIDNVVEFVSNVETDIKTTEVLKIVDEEKSDSFSEDQNVDENLVTIKNTKEEMNTEILDLEDKKKDEISAVLHDFENEGNVQATENVDVKILKDPELTEIDYNEETGTNNLKPPNVVLMMDNLKEIEQKEESKMVLSENTEESNIADTHTDIEILQKNKIDTDDNSSDNSPEAEENNDLKSVKDESRKNDDNEVTDNNDQDETTVSITLHVPKDSDNEEEILIAPSSKTENDEKEENDSFKNLESDNDSLNKMTSNIVMNNSPVSEDIIKPLETVEIENLNNEAADMDNLSKPKELKKESLVSSIAETSEDLNITLELKEAEVLDETNLLDTKEIQEVIDESNLENETKECELNPIQEETKQDSIEENQMELSISLDPEKCSDSVAQDLLHEQTTSDNPLEELPDDKLMSDQPTIVKLKSDEFFDVNKKIDESIISDEDSKNQKLNSNILKEEEKDLNIDSNELTNVNLECIKLDSEEEKVQDPLLVLDPLQTESIIFEDGIEEDKKLDFADEENLTLVFEESSQSPGQMDDHKSANDNIQENTIECDDSRLKDLIECNEPTSDNEENNKTNFMDEDKIVKTAENLEIFLETEENKQVENVEDTKTESKILLDTDSNAEALEKVSTADSELASAVKFLQESEQQDLENSKMDESIITCEQNTSIFVSVEDSECDNASELASDLPEITLDPIAISEAEIISEAAKLESEHKQMLESEQQAESSDHESCDLDSMEAIETCALPDSKNLLSVTESAEEFNVASEIPSQNILKDPLATETVVTTESPSKSSSLDECDKESEEIEIPELSSKLADVSSTSKTSSLVQKDSKQRLESPDRLTVSEPKITETPKKDSEKQQQQQYTECENVGSPRIILKIAKSAITECSEPRSPKSPKIRSAANSPNPEDSSGQKLGKIKLKLSKGGHPSIIPNNDEETAQWHTDATSSPSSHGMKIKLTKSSDSSVLESKHEEIQKQDESKDSKVIIKAEEGRKTEASIGMKIKLSKSGDASIVQQDSSSKEVGQDIKVKHKDSKDSSQEASITKKQDSPSIGMKIKLSKSGDASIIQQDNKAQVDDIKEMLGKVKDKVIDDVQESTRRTESPLGMKIKLSKSGDASVIPSEPSETTKDSTELKDKTEEEFKRTDSPIGVKIKFGKNKSGNASILTSESIEDVKSNESETVSCSDVVDEAVKTGIGMKIKLSKSGDASVIHAKTDDSPQESSKKSTEQPLGMKIKLSKTGDPSIIQSDVSKEAEDTMHNVKTKHSKNKDNSSIQTKSKDDSHLEMKIKLSKTGHHTVVTTNEYYEDPLKTTSPSAAGTHKHKEHKDTSSFKETSTKASKKSHSGIVIESVKSQSIENTMIDLHNKRKEITISPIESKKSKMEANLKMLPDITIQPITPAAKKDQKLLLETNTSGNISKQQMNVINQEISITQVCSLATGDSLMGEHLKSALNVQSEPMTSSPLNSDCEIIEPQPELIIVNENSNSSQDIMIIEEVPPIKCIKTPKKRGRPRRNANLGNSTIGVSPLAVSGFSELDMQRDPLSLDQPLGSAYQHMQQIPQRGKIAPNTESIERPRRTCRSQKSYAPPKRGRGRGRGKRKNEAVDIPMKKQRIDQDLTAIERATTAIISIPKHPIESVVTANVTAPELFKALHQPTLEQVAEPIKEMEIMDVPDTEDIVQMPNSPEIQSQEQQLQEQSDEIEGEVEVIEVSETVAVDFIEDPVQDVPSTDSDKDAVEITEITEITDDAMETVEQPETAAMKVSEDDEKLPEAVGEQAELVESSKDQLTIQEHQNWLAPSIKKVPSESATRSESISALNVMDEETRMSAESGSRSQTPARNMSVPGTSETLVNEESQGSTATTESEKVKVQKNRRMEINFDPDEGPFTVDKIAEYEWPIERKEERSAATRGETYMIQEQISQYLGVKSFKRKYPDLKRRMVDMEERNYLRENALVSESMCDMGLTAVSSSEVLDIMCSDFPEQYEEYRKHMREKAAKEHSKKQKELSAATNAERNRIDLAEMAMQSALNWNAGLNKARKDTRKCSLDLQTFTVHTPKRQAKLDPSRRGHNYPVALIPGQYTDFYREYTPAELRYYPLNTVLYGPMRPNERKFDSQSEGSQSDSDSDSSSDDSSSSSSEGTQDTEGSQSTIDEVDMELALHSDIKCKICSNNFNKNNRPEVLIQCGTCSGNVHPSCMDLTLDMVPHIRAYAWQCTDCKTCAQCHDPADEDKMLFCDMCDRGYHIYCVGLRRVPQGRWHCQECAVCANCGSKEPGGVNSDRNSVAQWQHEYKKGDKNTRVYVSTFCVPCSKLRGGQGSDN